VDEFIIRSPQNPDDVMGSINLVDPGAVVTQVERARKAQTGWRALSAPARATAMSKAAECVERASEELTTLGVREVGKPRTEMAAEVARCVAILRYYAQQVLDPEGSVLPSADGRSVLMSRRRPHGVVGLITPWNFPLAIPLWKAAPAMAYGNAVVLKPARQALATASRLEEIMSGALPDGLFSVVAGSGIVAEALIGSSDAVSFTGSVEVGQGVIQACAKRGVPVQAEMGGQNASIIFPDADVSRAADAVAIAAMGYAGQKCTATSRVVVVGENPAFVEALVARVEEMVPGDPMDPSTMVGPVIDENAQRTVVEAADRSRRAGARILTGASVPEGKGWYVAPTLIGGVPPSAELAQKEVFGPIAVLLSAKDDSEAIEIANGVQYGLVAALFTTDLDRALDICGRLDTGIVRVNAPTSGVDFWAPFGGTKNSSYGTREQGKAASEFYTWSQTVTLSPARRP
jgi:acyl-CoA reductase-like NAD-dependent aldehyde dehydrogenase